MEIIGGRDSYIAHSQDKASSKIFIENCLESIGVARESLLPRLKSYDKNPFWVSFLYDWRPRFDIIGDYEKNLLKLSAIFCVIVNEVRIIGVTSTSMRIIINNEAEIKSLANDENKVLNSSCLEHYNNIQKSSILFWRLRNDFEEMNNDYVDSKYKGIEVEAAELKKSLEDNSQRFDDKIGEVNDVLEAMEKKAGFLSLYAGFDKYARVIKSKLRWLALEKLIWVLCIGGALLAGLYLSVYQGVGWVSMSPLVGMIIFASTLLRVNLKKTDQYEQIMSKVEHKLAVSTFYQKELIKIDGDDKGIAVNEEYYKFLFSNIETTEWNTPDIVSDLAKILSSYRR